MSIRHMNIAGLTNHLPISVKTNRRSCCSRSARKFTQICEPIDAAAGARACLQAQKETSGDERQEAASAYKYLKRIYDLCNVQ